MTKGTDKEILIMPMETGSLEAGSKIRNTEKECIIIPIMMFTKEYSIIIKRKDKAFKNIPTEISL